MSSVAIYICMKQIPLPRAKDMLGSNNRYTRSDYHYKIAALAQLTLVL
jgi:hypothetical protein